MGVFLWIAWLWGDGLKEPCGWGTWLAQLIDHVILDLGVMNLNPTLGAEITQIKFKSKSCEAVKILVKPQKYERIWVGINTRNKSNHNNNHWLQRQFLAIKIVSHLILRTTKVRRALNPFYRWSTDKLSNSPKVRCSSKEWGQDLNTTLKILLCDCFRKFSHELNFLRLHKNCRKWSWKISRNF